MSDWNTLHLFDSKRFYGKIVPEIKNGGQIIDDYIKSKLFWYITRIDQVEEGILERIKVFSNNFDSSFKFHKELYEIESRQKKAEEKYQAFIKKRNEEITAFQAKYRVEIDYYTSLLPLIMFSECAQFNPHLILGRRIFSSNLSATAGSIAEACYNKITDVEVGGVNYNDSGYIINWLTFEEVKLLWLDVDNIKLSERRAEQYLKDFKGFLKIAVDNELGFISVSNVREDVFKLIEDSRLNIQINLKKMNFVNVIEYK